MPTKFVQYFLPVTLLSALFFSGLRVYAQTGKYLPRSINLPGYNHYGPAVSGDGLSMVYMTTYSESGEYELRYTWMENGQWVRPTPLPLVNETKVNYIGGYSLNYDGTVLYITSQRADGIGNWDIWYSERSGRNWGTPKNLGMPINSRTSEGYPSVSPDGQWLYFVRCAGMLKNRCVDCEMYRAKHRNGPYWNEPERLPSPLNSGHETAPRLMPDNRTLVFASARPGGKGNLDLYWTRQENGEWMQPILMEAINTDGNDEMVSIPAPGSSIFQTTKFRAEFRLTQTRLPKEFRPLNIVQIEGTVLGADGNPIDAGVQVYDWNTQQQEQFVRTGDDDHGKFIITIPEGKIYDFSVIAVDDKHSFYAERFDTRQLSQSVRLRKEISLERVQSGLQILLANFTLDSLTFQPIAGSVLDARRLKRLMRSNRAKVRISAVIPPPPPTDSSIVVDTSGYVDSMAAVAENTTSYIDTLTVEDAVIDRELIGLNRTQAVVDYLQGQGIPGNFMEKGILTFEEARSLVPAHWKDDRVLELILVEIIP